MSHCGATSLKEYIQIQVNRLTNFLCSGKVVDEAELYPCSLCRGHGFLIKNVSLALASTPSTTLKNPNNDQDIRFREHLECPTCNGSGLDTKSFMAATKLKAVVA